MCAMRGRRCSKARAAFFAAMKIYSIVAAAEPDEDERGTDEENEEEEISEVEVQAS